MEKNIYFWNRKHPIISVPKTNNGIIKCSIHIGRSNIYFIYIKKSISVLSVPKNQKMLQNGGRFLEVILSYINKCPNKCPALLHNGGIFEGIRTFIYTTHKCVPRELVYYAIDSCIIIIYNNLLQISKNTSKNKSPGFFIFGHSWFFNKCPKTKKVSKCFSWH